MKKKDQFPKSYKFLKTYRFPTGLDVFFALLEPAIFACLSFLFVFLALSSGDSLLFSTLGVAMMVVFACSLWENIETV